MSSNWSRATDAVNLSRAARHAWQRLTRGFSDAETWDLGVSFAKYALPRLRRFREINNGYPLDSTEEKWDEELDEMVWMFEKIASEGWDDTEEDRVRTIAALRLFGERYLNLWW